MVIIQNAAIQATPAACSSAIIAPGSTVEAMRRMAPIKIAA